MYLIYLVIEKYSVNLRPNFILSEHCAASPHGTQIATAVGVGLISGAKSMEYRRPHHLYRFSGKRGRLLKIKIKLVLYNSSTNEIMRLASV